MKIDEEDVDEKENDGEVDSPLYDERTKGDSDGEPVTPMAANWEILKSLFLNIII